MESIPERDYGYIEFHASSFAGLVLVPVPDLRKRFLECIDRARPIFDTWLSGLPILFLDAKDLCRFAANEAENVVP